MISEEFVVGTGGEGTSDSATSGTFKKILVATDLSASAEKAIHYAAGLAGKNNAMLYVIHVIEPPVYPYASPVAWPKLEEEDSLLRLEKKAKLMEQLRSCPHELIFQNGDLWPTLSDLMRAKQADLLILATRGRSGIKKVLMGSAAEKIFHRAPCPVLTIGPKIPVKSGHAMEFNRIIYATDFSVESLAAAPYAISLAREHRAQLLLLNCLEEWPEAVDATLQNVRQLVPYGANLCSDPICIAERGPHGEKILEISESHGADLIVLGIAADLRRAHFRHSDLYKVVTLATCPVLTVRT